MPRSKKTEIKTRFLHVRLSEADYCMIAARAVATGASVATYARAKILRPDAGQRQRTKRALPARLSLPVERLPEWMLRGQHLNFIAHDLNRTKDHPPPGDLEPLIAVIARLLKDDLGQPVSPFQLDRSTRFHLTKIGANLTQIGRHCDHLGLPHPAGHDALRSMVLAIINGETKVRR